MKLHTLSYDDLSHSIHRAASMGHFKLLDEVSIPEANVFLCSQEGRRFNVKFDIDYGASVEKVDDMSGDDLIRLEQLLESIASEGGMGAGT